MPRPANPDMYDSMASASAALGISRDSLKRAKEKGCPAFHGSRVDGKAFKLWWKENEPKLRAEAASGGSLRDQKLSEEVQRLKIANWKSLGKSVDKKKSDDHCFQCCKTWRAILFQKLINELPANAAGQDAPAIRILAMSVFNATIREMKKMIEPVDLQVKFDELTDGP